MKEKKLAQLLMYDIEIFNNLIKNINKERAKNNKNLTERQFFVLLKIYKHNKIELKNLSKELNVSNSSLCILLNKLVEQNYVYREEDSRDRRNTFYGITQSGEAIIKEEMESVFSIINDKLDLLDKADRDIMIKSLQNIKNISEKYVSIKE